VLKGRKQMKQSGNVFFLALQNPEISASTLNLENILDHTGSYWIPEFSCYFSYTFRLRLRRSAPQHVSAFRQNRSPQGPANHGRQHKPIKSSYKIKLSIPINVYIMSIDNDKLMFFCDAENGD
jgi:hypothetical protein